MSAAMALMMYSSLPPVTWSDVVEAFVIVILILVIGVSLSIWADRDSWS